MMKREAITEEASGNNRASGRNVEGKSGQGDGLEGTVGGGGGIYALRVLSQLNSMGLFLAGAFEMYILTLFYGDAEMHVILARVCC